MNINDIREKKDFIGKSFSNFKKSDVIKEYIQCILNNKIESACNWSGELICAGHFIILWDTILLIMSKYIHLGSPKLPIYILMRFKQFKQILENGYIDNELLLRNNETIRNLFGEITIILCLSNKRPGFESIKIKKDEFNISQMSNKFNAPNIQYAKDIFRENDPKEIFIAINELAYQINKKTNLLECCYWIEWIIEFDTLCRKKRDILSCESRTFAPIKFQTDIIWIIWEVILNEANDPIQKKCINAIMELFSLKFSHSIKKKRKLLLYFAVELIIENINYNIDIVSPKSKSIIETILKNLYKIYKNIKKNEIAPKTDYLLANTNVKSNLEKTVEKLGILEKIL